MALSIDGGTFLASPLEKSQGAAGVQTEGPAQARVERPEHPGEGVRKPARVYVQSEREPMGAWRTYAVDQARNRVVWEAPPRSGTLLDLRV